MGLGLTSGLASGWLVVVRVFRDGFRVRLRVRVRVSERAGVTRRRERVTRRDEAVRPRQPELLHEGGRPVELHEGQQGRGGIRSLSP